MKLMRYYLLLLVIFLSKGIIHAQNPDSPERIKACIVSDETMNPVAWTHIINLRSGRGTICDTSGNFSLNVLKTDSILIRNLGFEELIIQAGEIQTGDTIYLKIKLYAIKEVKIFVWGSSYADFKAMMKKMPVTENLGEKLGLPQQKGNPIPNFRNPDVLANPLFAITNPIDFLYYNFNKKQQSIRKVTELKKSEELIKRFESVYNRTSIGELTGLEGKDLDNFLIYLNLHFRCDFNCNEIQIVTEIYKHRDIYRDNGKE